MTERKSRICNRHKNLSNADTRVILIINWLSVERKAYKLEKGTIQMDFTLILGIFLLPNL